MMTYFVVFVTVACLPLTALSFSFTRKPEQPMIVVSSSNSTNVDFRWDFSLASGDIFSYISLYRYEKDKGADSRVTLGFYQVGYTSVNTTLYSLSTNVTSGPSSGYFRFTIKDIMKQINNKDDSKADPRPIEYIYRLEMKMANIRDPEVSDVEMRVLFLPESTSISISRNQTVFCRGNDVTITCTSYAKPPAKYSLYHNTKLIRDNSTSGVFSVTLNDTEKNSYTCVPYNTVGFGQNRSLELQVKEPPKIGGKCKVISKNMINGAVIEEEKVTLLCNDITGSKPLNIIWTNGSFVWNQVNLTFDSVSRANDGNYYVTVNNGKECTETKGENLKLTVYFMPESTSISISPNQTGFCRGSHVTITCTSYANPPAQYSLYHNTKLVRDNSTSGVFSVTLNDTEKNSYTCVPYNTVGFGQNRSLELQVKGPLNNTHKMCKIGNEKITLKTVKEKTEVVLLLTSSEMERLEFTWSNKTVEVEGQVGHKLIFPSITRYEEEYQVVARDKFNCSNTYMKCNFYLSVLFPRFRIKAKVKILNIIFNNDLKDTTTLAFLNLSKKIKILILKIYKVAQKEYLFDVIVIQFLDGSVWANFELELITNAPNPLQPLQDALDQNKGNISGLMFDENSLDESFHTTEETTAPGSLDLWIIIIIVIVVVVVLIGLIVLICWCCKKKRADRKNSVLVENNGEVIIMTGARNDGFSPSQYAERGPSHVDPASVDGVQNDAKDKNDNQTQFERETEEPAYAAVDKTKKTKKKNPGELLYADLGDFQKNGDKVPGSRGGIVLEPLPKGQHTKMPDQYEETIYADIVGTKKPASDNQNAEGTSTDVPLDELHGQANETEKPSGETADPSKPNDQKPATSENENPTDVQSVKPLAKEDSADSLHMNGRNNTTLTTVSL